jgi:serine protease Do
MNPKGDDQEPDDSSLPKPSAVQHSYRRPALVTSPSDPRIIKRARGLGILFLIIITVAAGFLGGWLGAESHDHSLGTSNTASKEIVLNNEGAVFSNIAKTVGPSVVSVDATTQGVAAPNFFGFGGGGSQPSEDAGTGIIISADGLIMTNRHVVPAGTTSVTVTLSDGTEFSDVQVVGRTSDQDSLDIAFLKIKDTKGKTLTPAQIGDSSKMNVGDPVVAIGNALGQFQNTVTTGIISGHGRSVQAGDQSGNTNESLEDLFQTDAAINEGNSGGPLVNIAGQVIGINTAIASNSQNIGFAIPINDVAGLIKSVEQSGKLQRPFLGVVYVPLTSDVAKQYSLSVSRGAYIAPSSVTGQDSIIAGGPAEKAGLKEGDIITKVDSDAVDENTSLTAILDKHAVGDQVTLTIIRGGKQITVNVTLGAAPTG